MLVQSKTPLWQNADLRLTRVKDELRGEVLIFKEAEWQTLRIEANALDTGDPTLATTPLRLIANQSKTRITIKKRLSGKLTDKLWKCNLMCSASETGLNFLGSNYNCIFCFYKNITVFLRLQYRLVTGAVQFRRSTLGSDGLAAQSGHRFCELAQRNCETVSSAIKTTRGWKTKG